jgi:hypothetical protein
MGRYLTRAFLACLVLIPVFAAAAEPGKMPADVRLFGTFAPEPGAWSEYAILDKATGKRSVMRLAIVGTAGDSYWYEVDNRVGAESNIIKMLLKGDPIDPENIQRLVMKSGLNPALELDPVQLKNRRLAGSMFEEQSGIPTGTAVHLQNVKTGEGVATVAAGTFNVELHQIVDPAGTVHAEYKFSPAVHPFGIVSAETKNRTVLLVGRGSGATSFILEEPALMSPLPGAASPPGTGAGPGSSIRQIPGMGTGYEPKQ